MPHNSEGVKFLGRHVPTSASIHAPPLDLMVLRDYFTVVDSYYTTRLVIFRYLKFIVKLSLLRFYFVIYQSRLSHDSLFSLK